MACFPMLSEEWLSQWGEDLTWKNFDVLLYIGPSGYGLRKDRNYTGDRLSMTGVWKDYHMIATSIMIRRKTPAVLLAVSDSVLRGY